MRLSEEVGVSGDEDEGVEDLGQEGDAFGTPVSMDGEEEDAFGGDVRQVCRYPEEPEGHVCGMGLGVA